MDVLNAFGIDYRVLVAQLLNFAILFFVLHRFGYKPILQFLDERRKRIEGGVSMAAEAKIKLNEALEDTKAIIVDAKKEATGILAKADELARKQSEEAITKTKEEIAVMYAREKNNILEEKKRILQDIKSEMADVIALALEKITKENAGSVEEAESMKKILTS